MYLFSIILFLIMLLGTILMSGGMILYAFIDLISLLLIFLLVIPMLFASSLLKDFIQAFKMALHSKMEFTKQEMERSVEAVNLAVKLFLCAGFSGFLIGVVAIMCKFGDVSTLGPSLAVAVLTLLYSILIGMILMPIASKIKAKILACSEENQGI